MICFEAEEYELYNEIIHNFLTVDIFKNEYIDKGDILQELLPKYLFREQYKKSLVVLDQLYEWTGDKFLHRMTSFHELLLYNYLYRIVSIQNSEKNFIKEYFGSSIVSKIEKQAKRCFEEDLKHELSLQDYRDFFYDVSNYFDLLFFDLDFTFIETLYNDYEFNNSKINNILGVNLDYYFDILPEDIRNQYPDNHINMTGRISNFIDYINIRISHGSLAKLFWENDKPIHENRIQIILENMMDAYFFDKGIDITREAKLGNGNVDFKLSGGNEKILIEVKKASSSYLKNGYERQLLEYIKSSRCDNAFYLIVCFNDSDIKTYNKFISENIYTDNYQMYINICYLDVRKKISASMKVVSDK